MSDQTSAPVAPAMPTPPFWKMFAPGMAIGVLTLLFIGYGDRFVDRGYVNPIVFVYPCLALGGFVAGWFAPHSGPGLVVWTFVTVLVGGGMLGGGELFVINLILQAPAFLGEWIAWLIAGWLARVTGIGTHLGTARAGRLAVAAIVVAVAALAWWDHRHDVSGEFPEVSGPADGWNGFVTRPKPWSTPLGKRVGGPVAIAGSAFATADGILYGINSNGVVRWMLPGAITGPVLGKGEELHVGLRSGVARVDSTTGHIQWTADIQSVIPRDYDDPKGHQLSVGPSGTLYVNPGGDVIHAINADGTIRWSYRDEGKFIGAPIEGPDGHVYVAHISRDLSVLALNAGGQKIWRRTLDGDRDSDGVSVSAGIIALPCSPYVYALRPDGTIKWRRNFKQEVSETLIDPSGRVLVNAYRWRVMDANGRALFNAMGGHPAFDGDLAIAASSALSAYSRDGRTAYYMEGLWRTNESDDNRTVVGPDGMLYVQLPTRILGMRLPTKPLASRPPAF